MRRQAGSTGLDALLEPSSPLPAALVAALTELFPVARARALSWLLLLGLLDLRLNPERATPEGGLSALAEGMAEAMQKRLVWLAAHGSAPERLRLQGLSALERALLASFLAPLAEHARTVQLPPVSLDAPSDWLAPFFNRWISPQEARGLGEHMTPPGLARRLLQQLGWPQRWLEHTRSEDRALPRLLDPACGTGVFLVQALALGLATGAGTPERWLEALEGWDLQPHAVLATRIQLTHLVQQARRDRTVGEGASALLPAPLPVPLKVYCQDALEQALEPEAKFPVVVGNPPWVGWETLESDRRRALLSLFQQEGLWVHHGAQRRLGAGKKDLSMLFLARALSAWLQPGGRLCFLLPYSLLASRAAEGLRRRLEGPEARPLLVDVLKEGRSFASTTAPAIALTVEADGHEGSLERRLEVHAGRPLIPWKRWSSWSGDSAGTAEVQGLILPDVPCGAPWSPSALPVHSAPGAEPEALRAPLGERPRPAFQGLRAWEGANTGGANGILWVEVLDADGQGHLLIQNNPSLGRKPVPQRRGWVEADRVYPLLRGREVQAGKAGQAAKAGQGGQAEQAGQAGQVQPHGFLLLTQDPVTRMGLAAERLAELPLTRAWLEPFRSVLEARPLYQKFFQAQKAPWYSIYNVGAYTLSPWKVVWREQARELTAAAVGPLETLEALPPEWERLGLRKILAGRPIIPDHKLMLVPCDSQEEASGLAAWLNSEAVRAQASTLVQRTSAPVRLLEALLRSSLP